MKIDLRIAAAFLALLAASCGEVEKPANDDLPAANSAALNTANAAAADPAANAAGAEGATGANAARDGHEDRSGPTREARCEINGEPAAACSFTPVLGDGSFDIDAPNRQLRMVVDGEEAVAFERIEGRRVPLPGVFRRSADDNACWVAEGAEADAPLTRVCAR